MTAATTALLIVTCIAAATDLRTRRIPNALTGAAALAALCIHLPAGPPAILMTLAAMTAAFLAGSLAFSAGWFGGGDVKLIAAACGLVGASGALSLVVWILLAGAVLAVATAAAQRRLLFLVRSTAAVAARGHAFERSALPYGVAIAGGSIAYAVSTLVPALRLPV